MLAAAAPAPTNSEPVIVAFGDSLTSGHGIGRSQAYPAVLQAKLDAANYAYRVVNAGISGDTTSDGVRRFDRAVVPGARILILGLGANDGLRGVPVATVRRNLETMIQRAQQHGLQVVLCGMEAPPLHGLKYSVDFHYIYPELAQKYSVPLVPFMLAGVFGRAEMNIDDGVHPNAEGARIIADNIWLSLQPLLLQTYAAR